MFVKTFGSRGKVGAGADVVKRQFYLTDSFGGGNSKLETRVNLLQDS